VTKWNKLIEIAGVLLLAVFQHRKPPFEPLRHFVHEGRQLESVKIEKMPEERAVPA